jgi:catechol-2,3-dioxygenase
VASSRRGTLASETVYRIEVSAMVYVTAVHMVGGERHEHIASVRWTNPQTNQNSQNSRAEMVEWIDNKQGDARVRGRYRDVQVRTVHPQHGQAYLRTHADREWTDNLLALPRY